MFHTSLRGNDAGFGYRGPTAGYIARAAEDIQTNGLAKTAFETAGQRCILGSLIHAGGAMRNSDMARIIELLPPQDGDAEMIRILSGEGSFSQVYTDTVIRAIDRIAGFNDDPHTTAEDVLTILKRLEES